MKVLQGLLVASMILVSFVLIKPTFAEKPTPTNRLSQTDVFKGARVTPEMKSLLVEAKRLGWKGSLNGPLSGIRTYQQQNQLYQKFLNGGPPAFAPGGESRHELDNVEELGPLSMAVDVSKPNQLIKIAKKLGVNLVAPYPDEPWHIEAVLD